MRDTSWYSNDTDATWWSQSRAEWQRVSTQRTCCSRHVTVTCCL